MFPEPDGAREPRARLLHARGQGAAGRQPGARVRDVPAPARADGPGRRHALRRRAADAGDRPRPDGPAQAAHARRAVAGPGAADREGDLRHDQRDQPDAAPPCCWSSRTRARRWRARAAATCSRTAAWSWRARARSCWATSTCAAPIWPMSRLRASVQPGLRARSPHGRAGRRGHAVRQWLARPRPGPAQGPRPGSARRLPLRPHRADGGADHPATARVLPARWLAAGLSHRGLGAARLLRPAAPHARVRRERRQHAGQPRARDPRRAGAHARARPC